MKLTIKQERELQVIRHFIPEDMEERPGEVEAFFDWSDKGIGSKNSCPTLSLGKQRRDLHISMYLEDWGHTLTAMDFIGCPRFLVEYVSHAMGKPGILFIWEQSMPHARISSSEMRRLTRDPGLC